MIFKKKNYHLLFLLILSISYIFPLIFFGKLTTFYHDNLDSMVVYNHVIGKIYREGFNIEYANIFLAGEIKYYYLRHIFKPFIFLYAVLNTELAYWTTDILFKVTSYLSFFILAKKITKNNFVSFLGATLFTYFNIFTTLGFGLAILPYVIYLLVFKSFLTTKHYFLLIFFGLNTDLIADFFFIPIAFLIVLIIDKKVFFQRFYFIVKILSIFFICAIISSSNIVYLQLFSETMHREEFSREALPFLKNIYQQIISALKLPTGLNSNFFKLIPYTIILVPLTLLSFFSKNKIVIKILALIIFIHLASFLLNTEMIANLRNDSSGFVKTFNLSWMSHYLPIIHALLFVYLISDPKSLASKPITILSFFSILLFQFNSFAVPLIKTKIFKESNYRNLYTFEGYYLFDEYKKVKKIVNDKRVLSIGLDPMIAVINNIKVIDGYHALYPLSYKKKFRKIIEDELKTNLQLKNYYDNWGSRVYAFTTNPSKNSRNFDQAKKLGAEYVISKNEIKSSDLLLVCNDCSIHFKLYKIK